MVNKDEYTFIVIIIIIIIELLTLENIRPNETYAQCLRERCRGDIQALQQNILDLGFSGQSVRSCAYACNWL